jgi:uncharacterized membrane protein YeaQ/YmgE (transglycosylase-associated protein family)
VGALTRAGLSRIRETFAAVDSGAGAAAFDSEPWRPTRAESLRSVSMGIVSWIVLGAIAGYLANMIAGGNEGIIGTIVLGIVGAIVGGYLAAALFDKGDVSGVNIESIVIAVIGAIIVLAVWRAVAGRSRAAS